MQGAQVQGGTKGLRSIVSSFLPSSTPPAWRGGPLPSSKGAVSQRAVRSIHFPAENHRVQPAPLGPRRATSSHLLRLVARPYRPSTDQPFACSLRLRALPSDAEPQLKDLALSLGTSRPRQLGLGIPRADRCVPLLSLSRCARARALSASL